MKKNIIILSIPLFAMLFIATSCGGKKETEKVTEETVKKVRVESVSLQLVENMQEFTATVESNVVNNISPAMGGRIRSISVDVGDYVKKGQTLVKMDNNSLEQQQTQLATLKRDYERYKELYDVGGISKQQLDQTKTQMDITQSAINSLAENTILRSPISGFVTKRNFDAGDVVAGMPILTVESINPVKLIVNVSESFYTVVKKGMKVDVKADALKDEVFTGTVSSIHPTINPATHSFGVEITVSNNDNKIKPGMFARVQMNFGSNNRAVVSDKAVLKQSGSNQRYVFTIRNGVAVYTIVELGNRIDDKYEIISGLKEGEQVVTEGNVGLLEGNKVEVIK